METGVWRTIGGRRIFIKKGESLYSAMKNSGKFNNLSDTAIKNNIKVHHEEEKHPFLKSATQEEKDNFYRNMAEKQMKIIKTAKDYEKQRSEIYKSNPTQRNAKELSNAIEKRIEAENKIKNYKRKKNK